MSLSSVTETEDIVRTVSNVKVLGWTKTWLVPTTEAPTPKSERLTTGGVGLIGFGSTTLGV